MLSHPLSTQRSSTLADRLESAQHRRFVGRSAELRVFQEAFLDPASDVAVLLVHGPGGIGKSTLLREFTWLARSNGAAVLRVDGRNFEPSPPGFTIALAQALEVDIGERVVDALGSLGRALLVIDTAELIQPIEGWLRNTFLPQLPEQVHVVIAGRNPPSPEWQTDSGWSELVRVLPLRNFRPEEASGYLDLRQVPRAKRKAALDFTHGHPLALSLVADILAQGNNLEDFDPRDHPNLVKLLLDQFTSGLPSEVHRAALEICAHVRITTQDLLRETLDTSRAHELFEWLRGLSFIEQSREGLFPHDLARDVLDSELRWRSPERYVDIHHRARLSIFRRLDSPDPFEVQRAFYDLLYLHRNNSIMRPRYDWDSLGHIYVDHATRDDYPAILDLVKQFEGAESEQIARYWIEQQPEAFWAMRGMGGEFLGFASGLVLREEREEDRNADPAVAAAWDLTRKYGPVRDGEALLLQRFQMARDTYQSPSPAANAVSMRCFLDWVGTPGIAWNVMVVADGEYWQDEFLYLYQRRVPEADFTVGGHTYAAFAHDWRAMPADQWLDLMEQRELSVELQPGQIEPLEFEPLLVLSQPEFEEAVRQAVRDLNRPDALIASPLMRSRLVIDTADGDPTAATLRTLLVEAAESLQQNPREERLYRAIEATYLRPASTQELAAERLGLPFSTYRYHLTNGVDRIVAILWNRELNGTG